jgi:hypothetical protein
LIHPVIQETPEDNIEEFEVQHIPAPMQILEEQPHVGLQEEVAKNQMLELSVHLL